MDKAQDNKCNREGLQGGEEKAILTMIFSARRLKNRILRDRYNSIIFEKGRGGELYLVGGYVRDILRGIRSKDRDYIVGKDVMCLVDEIKGVTGGTVVELRKEQMIRIALKDGVTLDFSRPVGTLEEDLSKRDYTINAIAWSPYKGIIDPYSGFEDIKQKKIRFISEENLIADPLRMLRAYRFAAELQGSIEEATRKVIKIHHNKIIETSSERITLEIFNLLNSDHSAKYLKMALYDGLLTNILSIPYRNLERNIKEISTLEEATVNRLPSAIQALLKKIFSQNLTYKGLLSLELLMQEDRVTVPKTIKQIYPATSSAINKRLELSHKGIKELRREAGEDLKNLFDIFLISKEAATDILIITGRLGLLKDYKRFRRIWKRGLLSPEEIIGITGVEAGPRLGRIIIELRRAQFEGKVRSKGSAIEFIRNFT